MALRKVLSMGFRAGGELAVNDEPCRGDCYQWKRVLVDQLLRAHRRGAAGVRA